MEKQQKFCPECGCIEFSLIEYNGEKICSKCGQSYFDDVDYSDIIGKHLREAIGRADLVENRLNIIAKKLREQSWELKSDSEKNNYIALMSQELHRAF